MYKRHWIVKVTRNGFEFKVMLYGTEKELRNYIDTELSDYSGYHGATEKEVEAAKTLGMKIYYC